jgi:hypothetical protein
MLNTCREELKELFRLDTKTVCNTADLLADYPNCMGDLGGGPLGRIAGSGTTISHVYINPAKLTEESLAGADKQCQAVTEGDQVASVVVGTK